MFIFSKPDREIDRVFIHCSASSLKSHDNVEVIRGWHLKNGWSDIGYNYYITFDGIIHRGRDVEITPAAQRGHNTGTIAICLSGLAVDDFTQEQFESLKDLCEQIDDKIADVTFHGHCEVSDKECPVFDYNEILNLTDLGVMQRTSSLYAYADEVVKLNAGIVESKKEFIKLFEELMGIEEGVNDLIVRTRKLGDEIEKL